MESDQWKWNLPIDDRPRGINENSTFSRRGFCETAAQGPSPNGNTQCMISDQFQSVPNGSHPSYQYHPQHYVHPQLLQQPLTWTSSVSHNAGEFLSTSSSAEFQPNAQFSAVPPFPVIQQKAPMSFSNDTNEVPFHVTDVMEEEVPTNTNFTNEVIKTRRKRTHPMSMTKSTVRKSQRLVSRKGISLSIQNEKEEETSTETAKKTKIYTYPAPTSTSYVIEHVTVSETSVRIRCPHCPIYLKTQYSYNLHVKRIHGQGASTLICKVCSKSFPAKKLIAHLWRMHYKDKSLNFKCPFCDTTRNNLKGLKKHLKFRHPSESDTYVFGKTSQFATAKKFRCNLCPTVFDTFFKLNEHVISCHGKLKYDCTVCGTLLTTLEHLDYHMQLLHPEHCDIGLRESGDCKPKEINMKELFKCVHCQSYFLTKTFLNLHQKVVHMKCSVNQKHKHKCKACGTSFEVSTSLIKHYTSCYARTDLNCYWCTEVFSTEDARENHFKEHHAGQKLIPNEILYKPHKCELCYQNFFSIVSLRIHFNLNHMAMIEKFEQVYSNGSAPRKKQLNSVSFENKNSSVHSHCSSEDKNMITNKLDDSGRNRDNNNNDKLVSETRSDNNEENPAEIHPLINSCPVCEKSFSGEEFHSYHKSYERLSRKFCEVCNKLFQTVLNATVHKKKFHGQIIQPQPPPPSSSSSSIESEAKFLCSLCYSSSTATLFHKHHSVFELDKDKLVCEYCNKIFFNKADLRFHVRKEHSVGKSIPVRIKNNNRPAEIQLSISLPQVNQLPGGLVVHTCNECLINFKTPEFLSQHILKKHGGVINTTPRPCCRICNNKTFSSMGKFHRHRRTVHDVNAKTYHCPHCTMIAYRRADLVRHISSQHGDNKKPIRIETAIENKTFKCEFCRRAFITEESLKRHLKNAHFLQLCETFCDYCGIQIGPERLEKHIDAEHSKHKMDDPSSKTPSSYYTQISFSEILKLVKEINEQRKSAVTQKRSSTQFRESKKSKTKRKRKKSSDSDSEHMSEYSAEESDTTCSDESDEDWISDVEHNFFMNETSESDNENPMSLKEIIINPSKKQQTTESSQSNLAMQSESELEDSDQSPVPTNTTRSKRKIREDKMNFSSSFQPENDSDEDFIPDFDESDEEFIHPTTINPKTRRKSKRKPVRLIQSDDGSECSSSNENSDSLLQNPTSRRTIKKETGIDKPNLGAIKLPVLVLHRCDVLLESLNLQKVSSKSNTGTEET